MDRLSLSAQNVRRMSRADYRYVPRPTHHFNFDEGAGAVVRDHFPGVGGADTAHFGPARRRTGRCRAHRR